MNNAQGYTPLVPLEEKTDDMFARSLDTGLWATFWSMQAAFAHMREQHFGRIVNFCSLNGVTGAWYSGDYNATKEAVRGLTRSAARELGTAQHHGQRDRTRGRVGGLPSLGRPQSGTGTRGRADDPPTSDG